jgi:hypothetical protein
MRENCKQLDFPKPRGQPREFLTQGSLRSYKPYHVVAAYDDGNEKVYVITAYEPSLEAFEPDYRTRRKQ